MIFKRHKKTTSNIAVICGFLLLFRVSVFRFISKPPKFLDIYGKSRETFMKFILFKDCFKRRKVMSRKLSGLHSVGAEKNVNNRHIIRELAPALRSLPTSSHTMSKQYISRNTCAQYCHPEERGISVARSAKQLIFNLDCGTT
jgi:hypothetical protein